MSTEIRFILAIVLMIGVLVVTNVLFPPVPQDPPPGAAADSLLQPGATQPGQPGSAADTGGGAGVTELGVDTPAGEARPGDGPPGDPAPAPTIPSTGDDPREASAPDQEQAPEAAAEAAVTVEGPLYRYRFSTRGARLLSAELKEFRSFTRPGAVELVPQGNGGLLGHRILVGSDTLDLRRLPFEPSDSVVQLESGRGSRTLAFQYRHPTQDFTLRVQYTFQPDSYFVAVHGQVEGINRGLLFTDLGDGIEFNEANREEDARAMAYVGNHLQDGIRATNLDDVEEEVRIEDGPFQWAAFKSKYFVIALLAATNGDGRDHLGGIIARPLPTEYRARVSVTQPIQTDGSFDYSLFLGPQEFARLSSLGNDLEDVNPYGWRFFRPVIRPFTSIVVTFLIFLHENLNLAYGWVLMIFGVLMRVVLFPLNQKAMRAQLRNMAVQPLLKQIQEKHKDNPEKLQKEMMKLYKEHGFNPVAGCLPMLLPWPILITLFFVFQNTIELRGVPFLWLPDLSVPDPLYLLPLVLMASMFLLQFISYKSMDGDNPQMKMMMIVMPLFMGFVFSQFAAGLNLYYATANVATLPQQIWIANERKKMQPIKPSSDDD